MDPMEAGMLTGTPLTTASGQICIKRLRTAASLASLVDATRTFIA